MEGIQIHVKTLQTLLSPNTELLKVPNFTQTQFHVKKNLRQKSLFSTKFKSQQIVVISNLYTKRHNVNKIPYNYLDNTLLKQKNYFLPSFPWTFTQKEQENATKIEFTTKHRMFGTTNLCNPRKFYTTDGCDDWDIKEVCQNMVHFSWTTKSGSMD